MFRSLLLFFILFTASLSNLLADNDLLDDILEQKIIEDYELLLVQKVTNDLLVNYKFYLESPNEYWGFLNENFLHYWDFDATTKALIGSEIFNSLSSLQFTELSRTVEVTLIRYAFESLSLYGEQRLNLINLKFNEQKTLAWLKINMDSPRFPDIHLDLLIKRTSASQWRGVDFRFKGITYINLKKNSYRQDFKDFQIEGFLKKLDDKNRLFFRDLCQSEMNYKNPKKPPCQ